MKTLKTLNDTLRNSLSRPPSAVAVLALALALPISGASPAEAEHAENEGAYSFLRVVEGDATLFQGDSSDRETAVRNLPVLAGDRLWAAPGSRLEVVLADFNVLRLDGDTEVLFESLAGSPEAQADRTALRIVEGNAQVVIVEDGLGGEPPRLDTSNATVYFQEAGSYRITSERSGWTQVVVREGFAEVVSERGSTIVRGGEEAVVEGRDWPRSRVLLAGGLDGLERWGEDLERAADVDLAYVDEPLRYAAADLADHGEWVEVDGRGAWRPHTDSDWRPYWNGRWAYTPAGLTWVSYESWGWVPYHYGSWDFVPHYGWVWFPGQRFAPAHVYWYWGPDYVAWYPRGYYDRYYSARYFGSRFGFRFGIFGYGGGSWNTFADWSFCPTRHFGRRDQHHYLARGERVRHRTGWREVPRGVVTTDTRKFTPEVWRDPERGREILDRIGRERADGGKLRDLSPILARQPELDQPLHETLVATRRGAEEPRSRTLRPDPAGKGRVATPASPETPARGVLRPAVPREVPAAAPRTSAPRSVEPRGVEPTPERPSRATPVLRTRPEARPSTPSTAAPRERDEPTERRTVIRREAPREIPRTVERPRSVEPPRSVTRATGGGGSSRPSASAPRSAAPRREAAPPTPRSTVRQTEPRSSGRSTGPGSSSSRSPRSTAVRSGSSGGSRSAGSSTSSRSTSRRETSARSSSGSSSGGGGKRNQARRSSRRGSGG